MTQKPYLLFDAGGTLVFPDFDLMTAIAAGAGIQVTPEQLFEIHCRLIYAIDYKARLAGHLADPYPGRYPLALFSGIVHAQKPLDAIVKSLDDRNRTKSIWTFAFPWADQTLSGLSRLGYRMSVISNADGRVEQILKDVKLNHHFEEIIDSTLVGASKPDKKIFAIAMDALNLQPDQALYIGDTYFYDVWGANAADLGCVHLDPFSLYQGWPGVHLPSVAHLPEWLKAFTVSPTSYDLHPAKNIDLSFEIQTTN